MVDAYRLTIESCVVEEIRVDVNFEYACREME
jgi:hypothetical protein